MRRRRERPLRVPLAEEEVAVSGRPVRTGGVEVHVGVDTVPEPYELDLDHSEVDVRRVPIGQRVDRAPPAQWWDGDELVIPVVEERLVVTRQLFVREEVRIRRHHVRERHRAVLPRRVETATVRRYGRGGPPETPHPEGEEP